MTGSTSAPHAPEPAKTQTHQQEVHVDEHTYKAALVNKLSPFYEHHDHSLVASILHRVKHLFFHTHLGPVDTSHYVHPKVQDVPEGQRVTRTVYALKKIKEFNHHFFNESQLKILNPLPTGLISSGMLTCFMGWDALLFSYLFRSWSFNPRSIMLLGMTLGSQLVMIQMPNLFNEVVQSQRRKWLATQYINTYGYEHFHNIINPNYDLHKLSGLHNKLLSH